MSAQHAGYNNATDGEVVKGSVANGHPSESSPCRRLSICLLATLVVVLLIFPVITIPILFTLIRDKKTTSTQASATSVSSSYSVSSAASASASTNTVGGASMTSTGGVQVGGGTTIYKGVGTIPTSACPKYLSAAAVFNDKFIVSNADGKTGLGTVRVLSIDSSRKGTSLGTNTSSINDMYQVSTLNQATGLFITISQGDGPYGNKKKSAITAGKVNPATGYSIAFGSPVSYVDDALYGSLAPSLTSLSNTSFAFVYYMNLDVYTRYGTVDPATLKVTLSPALNVTGNADYVTSMAIAGISATKYVIVYHNYAAVLDTLYAVVMTGSVVSPGVNKVAFTSSVANSFTGYTINGTFKATTLTRSDTGLSEIVVAYINAKTRAGLSCTLFAVNPTTGSIIDGSSLAITTGSSAAAYSSMSIVTIGTGSQFMVMFTNSLLQGATMAAIGQSAKGNLIRVSPNYVMNTGAAARKGFSTFVALAVSSATPHFSRVALLSSIADSSCATLPANDFSFMEVLPKPLGVMMSSGVSGAQSTSVSMSGVATGFSGLTPGMTYYTTTAGKLVTDGSYYGMSDVQSASSINGFFYVTDVSNNIMVGADSIIGVAISSDSILLKSG